MRYRHFLIILGVVAVTVFAYASQRVRQPTVSELSTVWVGWADSLHYFRLQLAENGTGLCGFYERITSGPRLYEVTKWTLKGYDIELTLKPIDPDAWELKMKGKATPGDLYLDLSDGRKDGWRSKANLQHESMIESEIRTRRLHSHIHFRPRHERAICFHGAKREMASHPDRDDVSL
jgi:hypothetical protein